MTAMTLSLRDELRDDGRRFFRLALIVFDDEPDLSSEDAAGVVDLLGGEFHALHRRLCRTRPRRRSARHTRPLEYRLLRPPFGVRARGGSRRPRTVAAQHDKS